MKMCHSEIPLPLHTVRGLNSANLAKPDKLRVPLVNGGLLSPAVFQVKERSLMQAAH